MILALLGAIGRPVLGRRHWEPVGVPSLPRSTHRKQKGEFQSSDFSFLDALSQTQRVEGDEYPLKVTPPRPPSKPVTSGPDDDVISRTAVFISYRRAETSLHAELIYKELVALLGEDAVFKDVDSLRPGEEFRLVLIGGAWVSIADKNGRCPPES